MLLEDDAPDDATEPETESAFPSVRAAHKFARAVREAARELRTAAAASENRGLRWEMLQGAQAAERAATDVSRAADETETGMREVAEEMEREREERRQAKKKATKPTTPPTTPPAALPEKPTEPQE